MGKKSAREKEIEKETRRREGKRQETQCLDNLTNVSQKQTNKQTFKKKQKNETHLCSDRKDLHHFFHGVGNRPDDHESVQKIDRHAVRADELRATVKDNTAVRIASFLA